MRAAFRGIVLLFITPLRLAILQYLRERVTACDNHAKARRHYHKS